jgi:cysteine desulfurase
MAPEQRMAARAYIDHNASSPLLPEARAAALAAMEIAGNASSVHAEGRAARSLIETARAEVATLCGAEPRQVVFTASASEAIGQAIIGGVKALGIARIILSAGEHTATLRAAEASGATVDTIPLNADGTIDLAALRARLAAADASGETALVAVHHVNNETGVVQDVAAIAALVGPTPHYLFIDAVQALGKRNLDFAASATDMMAVSAHKIGGLAGAGALLLKAHADQVRLVPGGGQELGRRGGSEALVPIAAFGAAAGAIRTRLAAADTPALTARLETGLAAIAPDVTVFGAGAGRIGNTVCFAIPGLPAAVALMGLDLAGIAVSSGSACSSGKVGASHVLRAMGVPEDLAGCALRASFGWSSAAADVTALVNELERLIARRAGREHAA